MREEKEENRNQMKQVIQGIESKTSFVGFCILLDDKLHPPLLLQVHYVSKSQTKQCCVCFNRLCVGVDLKPKTSGTIYKHFFR